MVTVLHGKEGVIGSSPIVGLLVAGVSQPGLLSCLVGCKWIP
jgi:hypothetical protein